MIRKDDVKWWIAEAQKHPQAAPSIVEALAERLIVLDEENERLRDEIIRLERRAPSVASSDEVDSLRDKVATLQALVDGDAADAACLVLLSDSPQSARVPLEQAHKWARQEHLVLGKGAMRRLRRMLLARPHEDILVLTSRSLGHSARVADLPLLGANGEWPAADAVFLGENEWLTGAVAVTHQPRFWTVVTRRGFVKQLLRIDLDRRVENGDALIESPFRRDVPVAVVDGDDGDLLLISRWGKGIRFSQRAIESTGATALGLDDDDEIVAALQVLDDDDNLLIVTAAGFAMRRGTAQFESRSRPGAKGQTFIQAFDVLDAFQCDAEARLLFLTYSGKLVAASVGDIPLYTRSGKGSRVCTFDRDPAVAVVVC
jgi:DNA gyrase subunit A